MHACFPPGITPAGIYSALRICCGARLFRPTTIFASGSEKRRFPKFQLSGLRFKRKRDSLGHLIEHATDH